MTPVEYDAVKIELNEVRCLICDEEVDHPEMLHDIGCIHCP